MPKAAATGEMASAAARAALEAALPGIALVDGVDGVTDDGGAEGALPAVDDGCAAALEFVAPES